MEFLVLASVVLLVLVITMLSRIGGIRDELFEMKTQVRELLAWHRAHAVADKALANEASCISPREKEPDSKPIAEPPALVVEEAKEETNNGATPPPLPPSRLKQDVAPTSPPPIAKQSEPSKFETAAKEILKKLWNWLIVGEEHRPQGVTMEYAVATTWLLRIGVSILVIGIGFFLKYSIAEGIIGPFGKVALAALAGVALLGGSLKLFGGRYDLLGQGLSGAGFATLYFTFFTAQQEALLSAPVTFALMICVTVTAGFLALRFQSMLIAVLGLLGGYLTPVMISSANPSLHILFNYLLVLGLGVFSIAARRDWRLLHYLSFAATWLLVLEAVVDGFQTEKFWAFMPYLVGFFLLFSTVTFIYPIIHRKPSTVLELLFLFFNAGVFFGFAHHLIDQTFSREAVAVATLGLALFYFLHAVVLLKKKTRDRGLLMSFLGLASFFVAITVPLLLTKEWITVSWSVQAFVMVWIASRMRSEFLRQLAYILYLIVLARFALFDLPSQYDSNLASLEPAAYMRQFVERFTILGLPIVSFFAAGMLFSREQNSEGNWIASERNDLQPWFGQSFLSRACFWIVLALSFVYLHLETHLTIGYFFEPLTTPTHTLVAIGFAAILLREMLANRETIATGLFWTLSVLIIGKVFLVDLIRFGVGPDLAFSSHDVSSSLPIRLLDYGAVIGFLLATWKVLASRKDRKEVASAFGWTALVGAFLYSSLEVWTGLSHGLPEFRMGGISIYWSLFSFALLFRGISKNRASLRRIGLLLMSSVVAKVFFVDLAELDQLYRIVAFIALGVIVLICSFLYLKYRHRFSVETGEPDS